MEVFYFNRDHYFNSILPFVDDENVKFIVGQRRTGKSYMLFQVIDYVSDTYENPVIIYINKELTGFSGIVTAAELLDYIDKKSDPEATNFLFIDEIQDVKDFPAALKILLQKGNYDIYCTGSSNGIISAEIANFLDGRCIQFLIQSLSYEEFLLFHKLEDSHDTFLKYIKYGGMPYLHQLKLEDNMVFEYLYGSYNTIILRDIVARYNIRNIFFIDRINFFLAVNLGSLLTGKRISDYLRANHINISTKLVLEYLQFLEDAFFIKKIRRIDIKSGKIYEFNDKFYFTDVGLRNTLQPFTLKSINRVLENVVYNKLVDEGFDVYTGKLGSKRVDFVAIRGDKTVYVQVVNTIPDEKSHEKEFGTLLRIKDNHNKLVISMDESLESNYKGIGHIHIRKFLLTGLG